MRPVKKLTVTAVLVALSVVLLELGSLVEVLDLSMAAIVSCFVVFFRIELRGPYPYLFWAATSVLTLVIPPFTGGAGLLFALLGLYPILKAYFERLPRPVEWLLKVLLATLLLGVFVLVSKLVLGLDDAIFSGWLLPAFLVLALVTFVLYDIALSRLIVFYSLRIRPRLTRFLK